MNTQTLAQAADNQANPEDIELPEVETEGTDSRDSVTSEPTPVPTADELKAICADIKAGYNFDVNVKPVLFRFKTSKDGDVETKREPLELPIPYPSVQGLVAILEGGGKGLELLMDAAESIVTQTARAMITEDVTLGATNFPVEKLSWEAIANMPKAERSGGGIAKEVWEDFAKDYIKVMMEVTGKDLETVTRAAKLLQGKFSACKTNIPVLKKLVEFITIYVDNSKRADEFISCVEFLVDKADKLINTTPEELLANL